MRKRGAMVSAALAVTVMTASSCSVTDSDTATAIETFTSEAVTWGNCESAFATTYPDAIAVDRLECASVSVPADYSDLGGPSIELAISRLPAASEHSRGTLFVNPGGPGIEGRSMPALIGDTAGMSEWDIIGVDVRGTGASPRPSCTALDALTPPDSAPEQASEKVLADRARAYIDVIAAANRACADIDGPMLSTFTVATAAADLEQVRSALGVPRISYFGVSWGTALGLAYRTLFPEHLATMVLDSTVYLGASAAEQDRDLAAALAVERDAEPVGGDPSEQVESDDGDAAPDTEPSALPVPTDPLNQLTLSTRTAYICNALDALPPADVQWSDHVSATRAVGLSIDGRLPTPANSELPGASLCSGWPTPGSPFAVSDTGTPLLLVGHRDETVTPYRWTTVAAERAGATVMTADDGNHGSALFGPCSAAIVAFLDSDRTPAATCPTQ
ncbi:alpha/beta fold hydrolase [Rhodococcus fascians]|nr:alpha/beta fold hydrolase [Rhodococcus fascians]MDP9636193.1 pimeloyl-ACP methyl ester carboxylesterase [Rhodococcus cercidiphylli]MBY3823966.1 alpha/beta fold hydrolase [Rhodococcus fascians]MBY3834488.1 alpha/beta fold hydrolase [Rhodococcus fascians]MBY3863700.1 alpha/beta fold hydrolase [Rhodococcus fascians]